MEEEEKTTMHYGAEPQIFRNAHNLRNRQTLAEKILWEKLRKNQLLGFKFRRQHPLKFYVADFYCHRAKLVIEVDGGYHSRKEQIDYDNCRDETMRELGIKVMRFSNEAVCDDFKTVILQIQEHLKTIQRDHGS